MKLYTERNGSLHFLAEVESIEGAALAIDRDCKSRFVVLNRKIRFKPVNGNQLEFSALSGKVRYILEEK